jgi:hypothetical protein
MPRADGKGRVPCFEILLTSASVRTLIRDNKTFQLPNALQMGLSIGMRPLDTALMDLVERGLITVEIAIARANKKELFEALRVPGTPSSTPIVQQPPGQAAPAQGASALGTGQASGQKPASAVG